MFESNGIYQLVMPLLLLFVWTLFAGVSILSHILGERHIRHEQGGLSDIVPSNILGLLSLILGFTFSMAISRYDLRRELVVKEANAIESAYLRSSLMSEVPTYDVKNLFQRYLDARIEFYKEADPLPEIKKAEELRMQIWKHFAEVAKNDRTDIAGEYASSLNEMFESANARNYAIQVKLPVSIYITILLLACAALALLHFDSGYKGEKAHWRSTLLILILGFVIILIFDLDSPRIGTIEVTQQAMIKLRNSM